MITNKTELNAITNAMITTKTELNTITNAMITNKTEPGKCKQSAECWCVGVPILEILVSVPMFFPEPWGIPLPCQKHVRARLALMMSAI